MGKSSEQRGEERQIPNTTHIITAFLGKQYYIGQPKVFLVLVQAHLPHTSGYCTPPGYPHAPCELHTYIGYWPLSVGRKLSVLSFLFQLTCKHSLLAVLLAWQGNLHKYCKLSSSYFNSAWPPFSTMWSTSNFPPTPQH